MKKTYSEGIFLELDAVELNVDSKFDGIYSNKVLHHLNDGELKVSIKRQASILKDSGIICQSFWKGKGSEVFKDLFVNYHSKEALMSYFKEDFDILLIESYGNFESDDSLLLIGKKK